MFLFHCNKGYTNVPQCYITCTLSCLNMWICSVDRCWTELWNNTCFYFILPTTVKQKLYAIHTMMLQAWSILTVFITLLQNIFIMFVLYSIKINKPTDSIEQSPWKSNSFSSGQATPIIYFFPQPHKSSLRPAPICWRSILILSHLSKWVFSLSFPRQKPICSFPVTHMCRMLCLSDSSWFCHTDSIRWGARIIKLLITI